MFVVTGGGRGLGQSLALALASRGKSVLIVGRQATSLLDVAKRSDLIDYVVADVSTHAGRDCIVDKLNGVKTIEGLVHNAGTIDPIIPLMNMDELAWQHLMATHVDAPLFLTQQLVHQLPQGRVLNISSGAAYFPVVGWSAYCVSKAALSMLTRCWQLECAAPAFASVMPGIIDTDMVAMIRHSEHMDPDKLHFFKQLKQNNQLLSPDTVALFLCWLLLDIKPSEYVAKEWDIYDVSHHAAWLPRHSIVPPLE